MSPQWKQFQSAPGAVSGPGTQAKPGGGPPSPSARCRRTTARRRRQSQGQRRRAGGASPKDNAGATEAP
eukprot:317953-Alexandrium_andersonii.AAC.1